MVNSDAPRVMSGGEALVGALAREGVSHVFGVPGAGQYEAVDPFYGRRDIRYVSCRNEQPTTYLADGYGRVARRPAAVIVLSGVGLRNAAPGLETAFDSSSPVLVISDHDGAGAVPPALAGIVKWGARATRPAEVPALVRRAVAETGSGRPRPVYLGVSHAVLAAREPVAWPGAAPSAAVAGHSEAGVTLGAGEAHQEAAAPQTAVDRAAALLAAAARPAIVAGTGVARAGAAAALCAVAERLGAPVATSVAAKGVFSDRHPLCLGAAHPPYRPLTEYLRGRDVVLLAGTGYPAAALVRGTQARTVRIDVEPRTDAAVSIQADAGWALTQLAERLGHRAAAGSRTPRHGARGGGGAAPPATVRAGRAVAAAALADRGVARGDPR